MVSGPAGALREALGSHHARDPVEAVDVARLQALIEGGDDVFARTTAVHVTGSAVVVHPPTRRVLLRWHPRMQMWMQVGGHFDPGEHDPLAVALREACEETGLTDLRAQADEPVQIVIVPVPANDLEPAHEHADFRYVLTTEDPDAIVAESEDAQLQWLTIDDAIAQTTEANLRELLRRVAF
ncbi:MAG TPA: NUDIX domain-containing protein [Acidimicrobiia bacterium]|jgi:8-oxo-dGTP pyrophosphatase MutT (NUDIX family)|nr:NUDIX domain-containing protein [Acidimicrobiia bacterium]